MRIGPPPSSSLMGLRIDLLDRTALLAQLEAALGEDQDFTANNVNVHAMNTAWADPTFRSALNASDLVFVDGAGVRLGARLAGVTVGERLTPADWIGDLFSLCIRHDWPVFWLGDTDEVGATLEGYLHAFFPGLRLAGRHHGFFAKEGPESDAVVDKINASGARLLMVGMSMPIQEKWLAANRDRLRPPVRLSLGGLARILTGHIRRGPRWMTNNGLEWAFRLCMQPAYTWRRYLIGNPLFLLRLLGWHFLGLNPPSAGNPSGPMERQR
jgi:N-acetylglucosaminyldiphosphoundecaprenol N-acetyl-beta-D-mannosaminyltransferase